MIILLRISSILGAEPSPAYFNILMWGNKTEILDGTQLAADYTFSGLQKFGQGLEDRLRGLKLPSKLLEKVTKTLCNHMILKIIFLGSDIWICFIFRSINIVTASNFSSNCFTFQKLIIDLERKHFKSFVGSFLVCLNVE